MLETKLYIALAIGLYEQPDNAINLATTYIDKLTYDFQNSSRKFSKLLKVYSTIEVYADQLTSQQMITLPELARLYGLAKKLSDDKTATAVLISLTVRHLAFNIETNQYNEANIADANNIIAATKTYFNQEATIDAMVAIVCSLFREPKNYRVAANSGNKVENKKLSGDMAFSNNNQHKVNRIRLLLIAAQGIADQVEKQQLDDSYILFTVKQELLRQGVDEKLANAIAIVTGGSYFLEEGSSIPKQNNLEQAAEWLAKSEALIHYRANQASAMKLLQEYMRPDSQPAEAIAAAEQLKQEVLSGKSIEGQLQSKGRLAELSWEAFTLVQDYGASYYFSPTDGAFKMERNNIGNGLYTAVLKAIQGALVVDADNPVHQLTAEQLSTNIRKLLPDAKGIIVEHFNNIIRNNASLLSVPAAFVPSLKALQQRWWCYDQLSFAEQKLLQQDLTTYLEDISSYYIDFANNNPKIACDIELNIIANYYEVKIKQHSHVSDNYKTINPNAITTAHVFCAVHQSRYYNLVLENNLKLQTEYSSKSAYIEQAAVAAEQEIAPYYLEAAIGILAQYTSVVWQASSAINSESLQQAITEAFAKTKVVAEAELDKYSEQVLEQAKQSTAKKEPNKVPERHSFSLPLRQKEQLSVLATEVKVNLAKICLIAAEDTEALIMRTKRSKKYSSSKIKDASKKSEIASNQFSDTQIELSKVRQMAELVERGDVYVEYSRVMHTASLEALGIATIEVYHQWWQNIIKEQLTAIDKAYTVTDKQIKQYIEALTKAYEQQLVAIDNHWAAVLNKGIHDYNYHLKCVAEAERTAKRKRKQKMYRSFAGMLVAAFVAPYLAGSLFPAAAASTAGVAASTAGTAASMGFGYVVTTGVIAGGISSAIAGNNVLKGAALGGLFAGFGFGVDGILGEFIKSSELLRESLSVAATASLSTVIYKGNLLDNVLASVGANAVASLIVPMPKFSNKDLTKQQVNAINNRQVMRAFTKGMTASLISKDSNLGMSLFTAGMSGLQSWVGHQANIYAQQRIATKQPASVRDTNKPMIFSNKQATRPTPMPNSTGAGNVNKPSTSGDIVGRYKINLPEIEHPCASAFRPRLPTMIPRIDPTIDKNYATVSSQPIPTQSSFTSSGGSSVLDFFMPAAYADDLSMPPYKPSYFTDSSNSSYLDVGFGEKLLILTGGGMKHVWSGIEQGYYMAGERLGILEPGTIANYTDQRNQEMQLYNSTPVGQSKLRPWVEFGTEMLIYSAIPVAGYGRMGLVANSALTGSAIGGLQFVEDGQLSSRFINIGAGAVVGAGVGVAANKLRGSLLKLYDARQAKQFNKYVLETGFANEGKLMEHFAKHGSEFKGTYSNITEYLEGAKDVMRNGIKVQYKYPNEHGIEEIRTGYVKFMGNTQRRTLNDVIINAPKSGKHREGTMKFEFVGTNLEDRITTYHQKNSDELFKLLSKSKHQKIITPKGKP